MQAGENSIIEARIPYH